MRMKKLSRDAVVAAIKKRQGKKSLRQFAVELGITPAFLCDIYKGRRSPGPKILEHFGIESHVVTTVEYSQPA